MSPPVVRDGDLVAAVRRRGRRSGRGGSRSCRSSISAALVMCGWLCERAGQCHTHFSKNDIERTAHAVLRQRRTRRPTRAACASSWPKRARRADARRVDQDRRAQAPSSSAVNPLGQTPALALDDGEVLTESVSICRYLEALHPEPPLFGPTPDERADRHVDPARRAAADGPGRMVWAHTHPFTARVVPQQYTDFGESQRPRGCAR